MIGIGATAFQQLEQAREAQGLPNNPAQLSRWSFRFAGLTLSLPNFGWRKAAIDAHDLHHLILDEPFTLAGECQVATWEFAAGAFPDRRAQIFCLPLVAYGAVTAPVRTWHSFRAGFGKTSLHSITADQFATLDELVTLTTTGNVDDGVGSVRISLKYGALLVKSVALYLAPLMLLAFMITRFSQ